jgi:hypothetical protein
VEGGSENTEVRVRTMQPKTKQDSGWLDTALGGARALEAGNEQQAQEALRKVLAGWSDERNAKRAEQQAEQYAHAMNWMFETGWKFPAELRADALDEHYPGLAHAQLRFLLAGGDRIAREAAAT